MANSDDSLEILRITVTFKTHYFSYNCIFSSSHPADWSDILIITYSCQKLKEKYILANLWMKNNYKILVFQGYKTRVNLSICLSGRLKIFISWIQVLIRKKYHFSCSVSFCCKWFRTSDLFQQMLQLCLCFPIVQYVLLLIEYCLNILIDCPYSSISF